MTYNTKPRRRFTAEQREAFLEVHGRVCIVCLEPILPGQPWDIEHGIARELLAPDADPDGDWNLGPIHSHPARCHKIKTARDRKLIAKSNRIRRNLDPVTRKRSRKPILHRKGSIPSRPFPKRQRSP